MSSQEDIETIEHMAEWDHGIEPNPIDVSYSAGERSDSKGHHDEVDILDSPKRIAKKVQMVATKVFQDLSDMYDDAVRENQATDNIPQNDDTEKERTEEDSAAAATMKSDSKQEPTVVYI